MDRRNDVPLVSVIMPAYNAVPFVEEAIASVIAQTVTDWELIVIDDCSTDDTVQIVSALARQDPRIQLLTNSTNMGVAKTRNRGLDLCRGQYVALLDSDDYWKPRFLEKMLARAVQTAADIVYCSYELVDEQDEKVCNDFIVPPETTFEESIVRSVILPSASLITSDVAAESRFPTNMYHEDIALWFQLLKNGKKARGVPAVLVSYRQRANGRSADKIISAYRRWPIYRKHLGMPLLQSVGAMIRYAYYGLIKYKRI